MTIHFVRCGFPIDCKHDFECVFTHTNKMLDKMIKVTKSASYFIVVKANNRNLFENIKSFKMNEMRGNPYAEPFASSHGREESREIWISANIGIIGKVSLYFPVSKQIATVVRTQKI